MPTFLYKARSRAGEMVTGTLAAGDRRLALAELGRLGYFPLTVESALGDKKSATSKAAEGPVKRVATRDLLMFTQQLSSLLRSGMSLSQGLEALERRTQKKGVSVILTQLRRDIEQGDSLSAAMARHPKVFSKLYVNMIRAGEASGTLDDVLVRLMRHQEQVASVREKVTSALIYPALVVFFGIGTITFFMTVMVPKFAQMFKELGNTLPMATRVLINLSSAFTSYWWIPVSVLIAAGVMYRQRARTPEGRLVIDGLKLRLPVVGHMVKTGAFALFARTLATLLENGVPVLNALQIVEETMTNQVIAREIREARTRVTDGTSISEPLAKGKIFPPLLIDMLAVGEESGQVVPSLNTIAEAYEQDLTRSLDLFTTLLAPAIIIVVALGVGGIALSVLSAVFSITSGIGK